jgi:hypothetical protein
MSPLFTPSPSSKCPNALYCPCSKVGIAYDTFVTINVTFHQVCSSQFIEQTWIDVLFSKQNISFLSSDDFRTISIFFWQIIAGFCMISDRTLTELVTSFGATYLLSPVAISEELI